MAKKIGGWVCDICGTFFTHEPLTSSGGKRERHFCCFKCKAKYIKIKNM